MMLKRLHVLSLITVCLLAVVVCLPAMGQAQTINLDKTYMWKMVSPMSPGQDGNKAINAFIKILGQRTNGKVKITLYEATLGAPGDAWDMAKGNAVQLAFTSDMYNAGRLPILSMVGLPMEYPSSKAVWATANEWLKAGHLKELTDNFKVLLFQASDPLTLFTRNKKVATLADLKGLRIRSGGGIQSQGVVALGAAGVAMAGGEVYMALQTGVIDGTITGIDMAIDRKFYEVSKYAMRQPVYFGIFALLMNKETWKSLPPELQKLIDQTAEEIAAGEVDRRLGAEQALWTSFGAKADVYSVAKEEYAKWHAATAAVADKYVKDTAAKGYPAKEAFDLMRKVTAGYRK